MARDKFIKMRASEDEKAWAKKVSEAVERDLSEIMRATLIRISKREGIEVPKS